MQTTSCIIIIIIIYIIVVRLRWSLGIENSWRAPCKNEATCDQINLNSPRDYLNFKGEFGFWSQVTYSSSCRDPFSCKTWISTTDSDHPKTPSVMCQEHSRFQLNDWLTWDKICLPRKFPAKVLIFFPASFLHLMYPSMLAIFNPSPTTTTSYQKQCIYIIKWQYWVWLVGWLIIKFRYTVWSHQSTNPVVNGFRDL